MNETVDLDKLAQEDCFWPERLREDDVALGGRFGLNEDGERGVLAQEDWR